LSRRGGAIENWYAYALGPNDVLNQMNVSGSTQATFIPDIQGSIIGSLDASSDTLTKSGCQAYGARTRASPPAASATPPAASILKPPAAPRNRPASTITAPACIRRRGGGSCRLIQLDMRAAAIFIATSGMIRSI
jgi:hypothetical protein